MEVTRKKIWIYWLLVCVVSLVISATVSMIYLHLTYVPEPGVNWKPIDDMLGMFMVMPFGWLISVITPAGWLGIIGLGLSLYKISLKPLAISAAGGVLFGIYWPKYFIGIMGI